MWWAVAGALIVFALGVGCGGGDETTTDAHDAEQAAESTDSDSSAEGESDDGDGGGAEPEELTDPLGGEAPPPVEKIGVPPVPKGGDDSIQTFGKEAGTRQSAEAAQAVRGFFRGRADGEWAAACYYLSVETAESIAQTVGDGAGCVSVLREVSSDVPRKALKQEARIQVGSVRIQGDRGFVVYKGAGGEWYAVPLSKEGGEWKLGAVAGLQIY